ncbi:MAG: branched-chain amino acid transport system substrate-binding protein [Ilumatobacteraceae bacterium]|nr:branched-chain amino acid transport system substrate-binding protein [Ilumatobacteraceae bacterium]
MARRFMAAAAVGAMLLVACGSDKKTSSTTAAPAPASAAATTAPAVTTPGTSAAATTAAPSDTTAVATTAPATGGQGLVGDTPATAGTGCGLNNGKKATGAPIKLGNVTTSVPGIDFSTGPAMMKAYFDCVNDNGGINGRPVQMLMENDNLKPEDAAAAARKLIETDKVVAMVGGFSIIDCPVNADYYKQMNFYVMVAGVPAECFSSPNISAANMGPGYSALGAAQIVVEKGAKGTMVTMTNKTATSDYNNSLAGLYAQSKGLKWIDIQIPPPIEDADGAVQDAVAKAGVGGAIVLNYTPPEGLKILKAAEKLGLIDKVIWGSSTPLNDNSVAAALGAAWKNKINVNAELSLLDDPRPEMELYRTVSAKYNSSAPLGSFQQMGFMLGRIIVKTLIDMNPADVDDPAKVNAAIKGIKNFDTHIVCKPWYFGALPGGNVPNNYDYNVVPDGTDTMVLDKDCFPIAEVEPILTAVRAAEKSQGLNTP